MNISTAKKTTAALFLIALMGFAGAADAYPGGNGRGMGQGRGMGMGPCPNYQNLTQEQQGAVREVFDEHEKTVAPLRRQLFAKQAELDALHYGGGADKAAARTQAQTLFREIADIKAQLFTADSELQNKLADKGLPGRGMGMGYGDGRRGAMHRGHGGGHGGGYGGGHGGGCGAMW